MLSVPFVRIVGYRSQCGCAGWGYRLVDCFSSDFILVVDLLRIFAVEVKV